MWLAVAYVILKNWYIFTQGPPAPEHLVTLEKPLFVGSYATGSMGREPRNHLSRTSRTISLEGTRPLHQCGICGRTDASAELSRKKTGLRFAEISESGRTPPALSAGTDSAWRSTAVRSFSLAREPHLSSPWVLKGEKKVIITGAGVLSTP